MTAQVMLFNASFEPLGNVSFKQAVRMLFRNVAVVHEAVVGPGGEARMIGPHQWPKAVRLIRYVVTKWMYRPAAYSRESLLRRDAHRCAYCGRAAKTVDHIVPQSRGGKWTWLNTVAACSACNGRKANRTPEEAGMRLLIEPYVPTRAEVVAWAR